MDESKGAEPAFGGGFLTTSGLIRDECRNLENMLVQKNAQYGDSALTPMRVFSRADTVEQIRVRIDDKLSRLARGNGEGDEDAVFDMLGYLILLRVAMRKQKHAEAVAAKEAGK